MMNNSLVFSGFLSIPAGVVIASVSTIGISGALVFTAGTALGAFIGGHLGSEFASRLFPGSSHIIIVASAVALIVFSTISGGWMLANLCGFAISFKASLLAQLGGTMLIGACALTAIFIGNICDVFSKAFAKT